MYLDFHTHGKLAKYLPFSTEYTDWLLGEAKRAGLDAICLTEHFNTQQFDTLYSYIASRGTPEGDSFVIDGLRVFPGMETDIAEGGHVLCLGPMDAIRALNRRLEPHKGKGRRLPFAQLARLDFLDLNGKDVAEDRARTEELTYALARRLGLPVVAGSDTHQAVQYGCIRTRFERDGITTVAALAGEIRAGRYEIVVHPEAAFRVRTAVLLKRALKEIHALGGDYVSVLLGGGGETEAVQAAKRRLAG